VSVMLKQQVAAGRDYHISLRNIAIYFLHAILKLHQKVVCSTVGQNDEKKSEMEGGGWLFYELKFFILW
jgi:hypothetical protein